MGGACGTSAPDARDGGWDRFAGGETNVTRDLMKESRLTCETSGVSEVVQTYPTYIKNATSMMLKAGAKVVISSPTPNNVFSSSGTYSWGPSRFDYYAWY